MTPAIFAAIFLYLLFCRPYCRDLFSTGEYMGKLRTTMLNGFFIVVVFTAHVFEYIPSTDVLHQADIEIRSLIWGRAGQLIVAGFLFYSGFGIMESIERKGAAYLDKFPYHRFFKVLLHFDIAILCFWLLAKLVGKSYDWHTILLSFTGWTAIGNSCWFICVVLLLYIITYISFRWCGKGRWLALWGGCLMLFLVLWMCKPLHWYNTLFCFPAGMSFSALRTKVESLLKMTRIPAPLIGLVFVSAALVIHNHAPYKMIATNIAAIPMAYGTALLAAGIDFRKTPRAIIWLGSALFSLYIYQRIPMIVMAQKTDWATSYPELFIGISFVVTIIIALLAEQFYKKLDKICFSAGK